jgi:hypothetical protein
LFTSICGHKLNLCGWDSHLAGVNARLWDRISTAIAAVTAAVATTVTPVAAATAVTPVAAVTTAVAVATIAAVTPVAAVTGDRTGRREGATAQRKQQILLSWGITADPGLNRNVSYTQAGRNDQVDLI